MESGPVTIGDLKRDGKLLEIECSNCYRHLYEEPARFPFRDVEPVPGLARRLMRSISVSLSSPRAA